MLHKDKILKIQSDSYDKLGYMSSRAADLLMRGTELGKEATDYIINKAGELVTGTSTEKIFGFSEHYDWQRLYEPEAISKIVGEVPDRPTMLFPTITDGGIFIAEPTALKIIIVNQRNPDEYLVEPIYCKCPKDISRFTKYSMCKTPADLKKVDAKYYWRMLDMMLVCESFRGNFVAYHPLIDPQLNFHTIIFERVTLLSDLNELKQRKAAATRLYKQTIERITPKD